MLLQTHNSPSLISNSSPPGKLCWPQRKQAQHDLETSEAFLKTVLASMQDHVAVIDCEGEILTVNEAWLEFARENDLKCFDRVSPGADYMEICRLAADQGGHDAAVAWEGIRGVLEGHQPRFRMEYECSSPDVQRWFSMTVVPLRRPQGGAVIAHHDITPRRAAEERAYQRERGLAEAQRIAHLGSWEWNVETDELAWSDEVYRVFGLRPQQFEATYEAFLSSVHPVDRPRASRRNGAP
jgi:PAS domain-containing protein